MSGEVKLDTTPIAQPSGESLVLPPKPRSDQEPRHDLLGRFREQVINTWLPKLSDEDLNSAEIFLEAESEGRVRFATYTPEQLHALNNSDRLFWKEAYHYEEALAQISFPVDVERSFDGWGEGPVLFICNASRNEGILVVNGNHRPGAAMRSDINPDNHPLFVVEFADSDVYVKIMGVSPSKTSYVAIDTLPGRRPR
jgi:hypothetical protein